MGVHSIHQHHVRFLNKSVALQQEVFIHLTDQSPK